MRAATRPRPRPSRPRPRPAVLRKLKGLRIPRPDDLQVVDGWPAGSEQGTSGGGYLDGTIYNPGGVLDEGGIAHETFHGLDDKNLTDDDRARLLTASGKTGPWRRGSGLTREGLQSPSELLADWYSAVARGLDPKREWDAGYEGEAPSRRRLLRFGRVLERAGDRYDLDAYRQRAIAAKLQGEPGERLDADRQRAIAARLQGRRR